MFETIYSQAEFLAVVLCCALAWFKGGAAERDGALLIVLTTVGAKAVQYLTHELVPTIPILSADAILAVGFLILAIRYSSLWLGVAMILQGIEMSLTAANLADTHSPVWNHWNVYLLGVNVISYLVLIAIVTGTLTTWSRRNRLRKQRLAEEAAAAAEAAEAEAQAQAQA